MANVWCYSTLTTAALLLAGCATPSDRIATELVRFGLNQGQATCVVNGWKLASPLPN